MWYIAFFRIRRRAPKMLEHLSQHVKDNYASKTSPKHFFEENNNSYKYLGSVGTPSGEINTELKDLKDRALRAYYKLKNKIEWADILISALIQVFL